MAAFQAAKGTAATDFTAASSTRLWTEDAEAWVGNTYSDESWMSTNEGPPVGNLAKIPDKPAGRVSVIGTPTSVEWVLESNWGPFAAGAFTLDNRITATRWLTLGWIENTALGAGFLVRIRDAWFHQVAMRWEGPQGRLVMDAEYAGRAVLVQTLAAGGITYPATPMQPSDKTMFPTSNTVLRRDPAGANTAIRFRNLTVTLNQGLIHDWDMGALAFDVIKTGKALVDVEFTGDVGDESWAALTQARAGTPQDYRIISTAESGVVLTLDLPEMVFEIDHLGHNGQEYREYRARGRAHVDSVGDYVSLTMA